MIFIDVIVLPLIGASFLWISKLEGWRMSKTRDELICCHDLVVAFCRCWSDFSKTLASRFFWGLELDCKWKKFSAICLSCIGSKIDHPLLHTAWSLCTTKIQNWFLSFLEQDSTAEEEEQQQQQQVLGRVVVFPSCCEIVYSSFGSCRIKGR
jgi:hypothetical protein